MFAPRNSWLRLIALALCLASIGIYVKLSGNRGSESHEAATRDSMARPHPSGRSPSLGRPLHPDGSQSIAARLAPGLKIVEGVVNGAEIAGPVKVTGYQPPSKMTAVPAHADGKGAGFRIESAEDSAIGGAILIEAASARATKNGVRFMGPVRLQFQGDVGQWYELSSMSEDSYLFVSENGLKKLFANPTGEVQFGTPVGTHPETSRSQ